MSDRARPSTTLYTDSEYHTADGDNRTLLGRFLPARAAFFLYLVRLVRRGGIEARRGAFTDQVFVERSEQLVQYIEWCGGRVHVEGLEHVHGSASPVVVASNHMSLLETFMFPAMLLPSRPVVFVVKQALMNTPYMKWIMGARNSISVGRRNPREDLRTLMAEGVDYLRDGVSVCVFPQSTRSAGFDSSAFNTVGIKLAERSGTSIMPVAVKTDFLGCGRLVRDFGPVDPSKPLHVCFGEPIEVTRANAKAAHTQTVEFIRSRLSAWGVPCT